MKNGLLVWNIVLSVIAGYLLFTQFSSKGNKTVGNTYTSKDSASGHSPFRIAYFEMDSVENHFNMVKDVKAEIARKEDEYNASVSQLDNRYRNKYNELQNVKSQAEADKVQGELSVLGEKLKTEKSNLDQAYQDFIMRRNLKIKKEIENFLTDYNKSKDYSYIVAYEQGLFYYKDTVYNITDDVIKGLNELYKNKKE